MCEPVGPNGAAALGVQVTDIANTVTRAVNTTGGLASVGRRQYTVRFLGEVNFPDQVTVGTGIGRIGNSSFSSQQALFVNGECVGLSDAAMVLTYEGSPTRIDDELRKKMERFYIPSPR